jgi:transposase
MLQMQSDIASLMKLASMALLSALLPQTIVLADRRYGADWIRELHASKTLGPIFRRNAIAKTRPASVRVCIARATCAERFFHKITQCRRVATRYDKLAASYLTFIKQCHA